ncbi:MAG: 2-C-methyl-D-erythritol 4-phosphate cytidylyltransferase [Deltaproteobacteria bacterium]|nr:2-C-methyl-D-erythritol 4-phosphate cytidylyltransferase [Deltaproteobacteria bacterium]MBW1815655.1 2-C-methyl-D-erythritol 4-phosphate cytidylyltransferase [Deltaproteobacteria bacterium]
MKTIAVIPGAGSGTRMGGRRAKQFLDLCGMPLLAVTLKPFQDCRAIDGIVVVAPPSDLTYCREGVVRKFGFSKVTAVVPGGLRRQDSVRAGLEAAGESCGRVVIHDAARPLITTELLDRVLEAAEAHGSVIAGLPAKETVKAVSPTGEVLGTHDRTHTWLIQTPQVFPYKELMQAHQASLRENLEEATDDALLMERLGLPVWVVEGTEENIKVTTPRDLALARMIMEARLKR